MPQLDPTPWFTILLSSWLILLVIPSKVTNYIFNYNPLTANKKKDLKNQKDCWAWPWY